MKRRILPVFCVLAAVICFLTAVVSAETFQPDNHGLYTVSLDMEPASEYIMIAIKGEYDQTNYIEAYNMAEDSEIIYFEQKASDENGLVTFGPFAPNGYYDATVIVGGTSLDEPYLAGYLGTDGVSNSASIVLSGFEQSYEVEGVDSFDYTFEIKAEVLDSFGYPSMTNEEVTFELLGNTDDITIDGNKVTISKTAKEQTFTIKAVAGDAVKTSYVQVNRMAASYRTVEIYLDEECSESVDEISVLGVAGSYPEISVYAKSFNQYGEEIEDTHTYLYDGLEVDSTFVTVAGNVFLTVKSNNSVIEKSIVVTANERPDYKDSALELHNLIISCREKAAEEKNISTNGREIYPEETWTTQAAVDTFAQAIEKAETALEKYGSSGYSDSDYADEVTALTKALGTYDASFKAGVRVDIASISVDVTETTLVIGGTVEVKTTSTPRANTDVLTWTSSDDSVATVTAGTSGRATVKGVSSGKATITATTRNGLTATTEVTVIKKATQIMLKPTSATATYGSEPVVLKAQISPKDSTDIIEWTYDETLMNLEYSEYTEGAYRVIEATVIPKAGGKSKVQASAVYGEKESPECTVTTVMPAWETAAAPKASKESGAIIAGTEVALTSSTDGTAIYYTLDGSTPTKETGRLYRNPVHVSQSLVLKAIAVGEGMYDSEVSTYEYAVVDTSVEISSVSVQSEKQANLAVVVKDFENVKTSTFVVEYDTEYLESEVTVICETLDGVSINHTAESGKITFVLSNENGFTFSGKIATLGFDYKADTPEGDYAVRVTESDVEKVDGTVYHPAAVDGNVNINNFIIGDVNDDGKVGLADILLIKQYLAGDEYAKKNIVLGAADTDADGDIDNDDVTLLSKYCVGWNVTLGKKDTEVSFFRIISNYKIDLDENNKWRAFYEVYNPFTGMKEYDISSVSSAEKANELGILKSGTIVNLNSDEMVDENAVVGTASTENMVWITSAFENEMVVVPVDNTVECKNCVSNYMGSYKGNSYNDIFGNEQKANSIIITDDTKFSVMEYSNLSESFFNWAIVYQTDYSEVKQAKKYIRSYNDKSIDREDNYVTTYSDYVKAYVCVNNAGEADFVIVVVHGNDAAAYNVACDNCK